MTVGDLIEILSQYPTDMLVLRSEPGYYSTDFELMEETDIETVDPPPIKFMVPPSSRWPREAVRPCLHIR